MSSTTPATAQSDRGNAVIAVTSVFTIATLLVMILKMTMSALRRRKFRLDDAFLVVAVIFGFACAICTGYQVANGLGRPAAIVQPGTLGRYFKLSYASIILMFCSIAASRHSLVALVFRATAQSSPMRGHLKILHPIIGAWTIFSILGFALECDSPMPWIYLPSRCAGRGAIWYPILVFGILIDAILALGFVPITRNAQIDRSRKDGIVVFFSLRIIVVVLSIAYLTLLASALKSNDQTWSMAVPVTFGQVVMNLSIIAAIAPSLLTSIAFLENPTSAAVISEITAVTLDPSHSRATSDENNRLRDWAFAQLRNSPTPSSLVKEISIEITKDPSSTSVSPAPPAMDEGNRSSTLTAPAIPPRSARRSVSPQLSRASSGRTYTAEIDKAWFADERPRSTVKDDTIHE